MDTCRRSMDRSLQPAVLDNSVRALPTRVKKPIIRSEQGGLALFAGIPRTRTEALAKRVVLICVQQKSILGHDGAPVT